MTQDFFIPDSILQLPTLTNVFFKDFSNATMSPSVKNFLLSKHREWTDLDDVSTYILNKIS